MEMPREYAAVLDAVRKSPGDDLPRLALADIWQEAGDEDAAEFIRDGVALAATGLTACPHKVSHRPSPHSVSRLIPCGRCDFCELERRCEWHHESGAWNEWAGYGSTFGYAHTARHHSHFVPVEGHPSLYAWRGLVDRVECDLRWWFKLGGVVTAGRLAAVRDVAVHGKRPLQYDDPPFGSRWTWLRSEIIDQGPHHLPSVVTRQMNRTTFDTEEDAAAELSAALLRLADLPF